MRFSTTTDILGKCPMYFCAVGGSRGDQKFSISRFHRYKDGKISSEYKYYVIPNPIPHHVSLKRFVLHMFNSYYDRYDRSFYSSSALEQHEADSSNPWICYDCRIEFETSYQLEEHFVQSPRHPYCRFCQEHFYDREELQQHYRSNHGPCPKCRRVFATEYGLEQHRIQGTAHQPPTHHYCAPCKIDFHSAQNLIAHRNSSVHKPNDVTCPMKGCGQGFVSRSALILHLESGRCPSGADRATVNRYVRQLDKNNVITDPARMLTDGRDDIKYIAGERSWNGYAYECYLCHNTFRSLTSLNNHLASPTHQNKIYVCPLSNCRARFTTLSGLCQHIESEKCGVARFKAVKDTMDDIFGKMKRLTL